MVFWQIKINQRERLIRSISEDLRNQIVNHARTSRREIQRSMFVVGDQIGKGNFGKAFEEETLRLDSSFVPWYLY